MWMKREKFEEEGWTVEEECGEKGDKGGRRIEDGWRTKMKGGRGWKGNKKGGKKKRREERENN